VDSWALGRDGAIYGGNAGDGRLFRLDPARGRIVNLGKPVKMPRLKGLAFGHDGELYGVAGGAPGYSHLFRYDPRDGFVDLSNPIARSETLRSTAPCRPRPCRGHRAGSAGSRNRCRGTSLRA
jgi:hypothetical protein